MTNKLSTALLLSIATCFIGTSFARPINPLTERIHDGAAKASIVLDTVGIAREFARIHPVDFSLTPNYSGIKSVYIKHSWWTGAETGVSPQWPVLNGGGGDSSPSVSVPEPGTLALIALGLIGLAFTRRRHPR